MRFLTPGNRILVAQFFGAMKDVVSRGWCVAIFKNFVF
jgi:hypothetical protein